MPIYEYICPACGHPFEKRVGFADADKPQPCPACGHAKATKQISLIGRASTGSGGTSVNTAPACGPVG